MAHGERMKKGEDAAAAAEKVEDGDKDSTIVLSDEEVEQFVTVKKRTKKEEEKRFCTMRYGTLDWQSGVPELSKMWNCKFCNRKYHFLRGRGSLPSPATSTDQRQRYIECPGDWRPDT